MNAVACPAAAGPEARGACVLRAVGIVHIPSGIHHLARGHRGLLAQGMDSHAADLAVGSLGVAGDAGHRRATLRIVVDAVAVADVVVVAGVVVAEDAVAAGDAGPWVDAPGVREMDGQGRALGLVRGRARRRVRDGHWRLQRGYR